MRITAIAAVVFLTALLAVGGCARPVDQQQAAAPAPADGADKTTTTADNSPWGTYSDDAAGKIIGIWTDSKTHCQYFLGDNIMTPRLGDDGKPICDASQTPPATSTSDGSSSN